MVEYRSRSSRLVIRLRGSVRTNVNGKEYFNPGLTVNFSDGSFITEDEEIIKAIDELLNGKDSVRWTRKVSKVPSQEEMRRIQAAAEAGLKAQKSSLEKNPSTKKSEEDVERFNRFVDKTSKEMGSSKKIIKGMRGI